MFSACEMLEPLDEELDMAVSGASGASPQVIFTATLGLDSKTTLEYDGEAYKTVWTDNDIIYVIDPDTGTTEACSIVDGMGTKTATFAGTLQADSYIAVYGNNVRRRTDGSISLSLSSWQSFYGSFSLWSFPMVAQSDSKSFSFKNLCSVLNLRVTGNGEILNNIKIRSNDSEVPVYGDALIDLSGEEPSLDLVAHNEGADEFLYVGTWTELNAEPSDIFIVLPAQTYPGGFTLTLVTDDNEEKSFVVTDDVEMRRSRIRNLNLSYSEGLSTDTWGICGTMTEWGETEDIALTPEGEYYVLRNQYLAANSAFKFRKNGFWGAEYGAPAEGWAELDQDYNVPTNTKVLLEESGGRDIYITFGGYYDIYLNPDTGEAFVMASGIDPASLPTMDAVGCYGYNAVANMSDGSMIALSGTVMEVYERGFLLDIKGYYNETILVYQTYFSENYSHIRPGNYIDLYATKNSYRDLPQVTGILWMHVWSDYETYYTDSINDLLDPDDFADFNPGRYAYVKYKGTLRKNGTYYNIEVDGVTGRQGSIEYPLVSLDEFVDKQVLIEGYFVGFSGSYMKTVLRKISFIQNDSSNEFITPGDDIILTGVQK